MEEEDPRKFWKRRNPFFGLFEEFDKMDDMMEEMMKRAFSDMSSMKGKPMNYGFSMKIGPDGKPQIREFGNVKPTEQKIEMKERREPLIDVIDHNDKIDIIAELPGVEKRNIDLRITNGDLVISVPKKFLKQVHLKDAVDKDKIDATYKNGVLTVTLKKIGAKKKVGKKINVN